MKLRPYQEEFVSNAIDKMEKHGSTLGVMATGLGKSVSLSYVAKHYAEKGKVLILAHRQELIYQLCGTLSKCTNITPQIEMGELKADSNAKIIVSTFQSQYSGEPIKRYERFIPGKFSLVIIDEAHHAVSDSYKEVADYYMRNPDCKLLGVTATPDRGDEVALGKLFRSVCYEYGIKEGIDDGWLVPIKSKMIIIDELDLSTVRVTCGDFSKADLEEILTQDGVVAGFAQGILDKCGDLTTLVFCACVEEATKIAAILNASKPNSAHCIFGHTDKNLRPDIVNDFRKEKYQYLVGVGVPTEGFDAPSIRNVVMCRPTKSRALYTQMLGRGTRPLPKTVDGLETADERIKAIEKSDKPCINVLDFTGNSGKHKLVTPCDILGGNYDDDVRLRASQLLDADGNKTIEEALEEADKITKEEKLKHLQLVNRKIAKLIASGDIVMALKTSEVLVNPFDLFDIKPEPHYVNLTPDGTATEPQRDFLAKNNVDPSGLTRAQASKAIDALVKELNKPSAKLKAMLIKFGYPYDDINEIQKDHANKMKNRIIANGWRPTNTMTGKKFWE